MVSSTSALRLGCKILFWPQSCVSDLAEVDFKIVWSIEYHLVSRICAEYRGQGLVPAGLVG